MGVPGLPNSKNCIFRPQNICPRRGDRLAAPTILVPRPLVGQEQQYLRGVRRGGFGVAQKQRMALPHPTTHCPSEGAALAVPKGPKERALPLS